MAPTDTDGESSALIDQLAANGVVVDTADGADLTLGDSFRADWWRRIERLRERSLDSYLAMLLDASPDALSVTTDDGYRVTQAGRERGDWPSKAAALADVAAFITLQEWLPAWEDLSGAQRDELLGRLRVFLDRCPACDGTVVSRAHPDRPIPKRVCTDCGARLL